MHARSRDGTAQRTAEQVEHRVQRPANEKQVTIATTGDHLAGTAHQGIQEPQVRLTRSPEQGTRLISGDQVPAERNGRLLRLAHGPYCAARRHLAPNGFPATGMAAVAYESPARRRNASPTASCPAAADIPLTALIGWRASSLGRLATR